MDTLTTTRETIEHRDDDGTYHVTETVTTELPEPEKTDGPCCVACEQFQAEAREKLAALETKLEELTSSETWSRERPPSSEETPRMAEPTAKETRVEVTPEVDGEKDKPKDEPKPERKPAKRKGVGVFF